LAIVGLGCIFPRSPDVRRYWQNIIHRFDAVEEVPADRWRWQDFYDPDRRAADRCYSKWGAFLEEIVFDPFRYRMPPATMASIEPVQLMALEVARQALEDAGIERPEFPRERTAVLFAAAGSNDLGLSYSFRTGIRHWLPRVSGLDAATRERIVAELEQQLPRWTEDSFAGFLLNVVAGRISNRFDLKGSNFTVDAACASSFAALQTAAAQLWSRACDAALVGAVDGTNNPFTFMCFSKTYALSPEGRSRPFDVGANGIGLGEGIGAVVLKRLDDARRDGDKIYAVIRGIGSSSDGAARSLTAPFPDGQALALRRAYRQARVSPATVTLVEAHGTGTTVGDQVEVQALTQSFAASGAAPRTCAIGSVKSMIGHTKTVAGLASLIKTTLALRHKILPPTIGVETPNPALSDESCPFYVSAETRPWFDGRRPRRAGVSAFGFGGTNFHVVLEEYREQTPGRACADLTPRSAEVLFWSRPGRELLLDTLRALDAQLAATPTDDLAQLACAVHQDEQAAAGDTPGACRLAIVATSVDDLRKKMAVALEHVPAGDHFDDPTGVYFSERPRVRPQQVCFLFPGQGSQSVNMLRELVLASPWAWDVFEQADRELAGQLSGRLTERIYPRPVFNDADRRRQQEQLTDTRVAQPALGLVELFALRVLERFGVQPGMTAGHSYGEYVALCAAGAFDHDALVRLSALRGQATYAACASTPGAMASVAADGPKTMAALLALKLDAFPANFNAAGQTVIAGTTAAIQQAVEQLPSQGLQVRKIPVTAPFHTPMVAAVAEVMRRHLAQIEFRRPRLPVYSNTTGGRHMGDAVQIRERLAEHIARPVRFAKMIQQAHADGARVFVEVGPGAVLTALVRRNLADREHLALAFDGPTGWNALGQLLGRLAVEGLAVAWHAWFDGRGLRGGGVDECFRAVQAKHQRKPTDWIVGPGGARPCVTKPQRSEQAAPAAPTVAVTASVIQTPISTAPVASGANGLPGIQSMKGSMRMGSQEPSNVTTEESRVSESDTQTLIGQFQANLAYWLDLQRQYLEIQQTVMLACLQGSNGQAATQMVSRVSPPISLPRLAAPAPTPPAPLAAGAATPAPAVPAARPSAPPAPVLPALKPTAPAVKLAAVPAPAPVVKAPVAKPTPAPTLTAKPTTVAASASAAQPTVATRPSSNGHGAPPVEVFRQDLLDVISDRTGYPIEMLDENVDLETGLGIDSIKTLEILSMLGKYHAYLPGASTDQEETMTTFASLRTIGDIVNSYRVNSQRQQQSPALAAPPHDGNGSSPSASVERATLELVAAGHEGNGAAKKKSSLEAISSS
jgi:acyl transferase domain-containing protein